MLVLNTFGPAFGQPDASPFVVKSMCLLSMAGADWRNNPGYDVRKAPYQKLPVLHDGDLIVADSENIKHHLENTMSVNFDASLNDAQRAQSRALVRMTEEHLYFCGLRDRWMNDETWAEMKAIFFSGMPPVVGPLVSKMVRKSVVNAVKGQGLGRLEYPVMLERATRDLVAIEQALGDQTFLYGDEPTSADASVGAILAAVAANPSETDLKQAVLSRDSLLGYMDRVSGAIYPKEIKVQQV